MSHEVDRKRSRDTYEGNTDTSIAPNALKSSNTSQQAIPPPEEKDRREAGEWQTVEPRNKRRKKQDAAHNYPTITHSSHARLQSFVKIGDLQNLVLYLLADGNSPQWCSVRHHNNVRKVVVLMIPGLEPGMFTGTIPLTGGDIEPEGQTNGEAEEDGESQTTNSDTSQSLERREPARKTNITPDDYYPVKLSSDRLPEPLHPLALMFEHIWPVKTPGEDRQARMHSPLAAMLIAPIVKAKETKATKGPQFPAEGRNWKNQHVPVISLLATPHELADENYVLHPSCYDDVSSTSEERAKRETNGTTMNQGWVDLPIDQTVAKDEAGSNGARKPSDTGGDKVLAMDCEMCITSPQGITPQVFSLTRISIIDWDGKTVLDEFVKPAETITDYLTPYSGITPEILKNVTTTLSDIQHKLKDILTSNSILIGHSLNSDLNALHITFPRIIDTALLYPHPRGPPLKSSLKWLSQKYLSREIQKGHGSTGHDSIEDARACLDLVKQKCEKGKTWGTSEANGEPIFKRIGRAAKPKPNQQHSQLPTDADNQRAGAVVDWGDPSRGYGGSATVAIGCQSDEEVVKGVHLALTGVPTAEENPPSDENKSVTKIEVPSGGCDFVWARLRELEAHRGWYTKSKTIHPETASAPDANGSATLSSSSSTRSLAAVTAQTAQHIREIYDALPARTAFVVYSGSGDPRELHRMQEMHKTFKTEYRVKKWDQLSVKWTDTEEQQLKKACEAARRGCAFITVK